MEAAGAVDGVALPPLVVDVAADVDAEQRAAPPKRQRSTPWRRR